MTSTSTPPKEELFPVIGAVAEQADQQPENENAQGLEAEEGLEDRPLQEIESLCMKCGEQGITRMLLTTIPYFRQVILMSFRCEHCGSANNEIQSAGEIRPSGTLYTARILTAADLDRQIVRSASASIIIPEFELTLPPISPSTRPDPNANSEGGVRGRTGGQLTTVEGLIRDIVLDLSMDQPLRKVQDEKAWKAIEDLLGRMTAVLPPDDDEENETKKEKEKDPDRPIPAFTIKLDDPAGNSWIEFIGSMADPKWNMRTYPRTLDMNVALGLVEAPEKSDSDLPIVSEEPSNDDIGDGGGGAEGINEEIYVFPGVCSSCGHPLDTLMKKVNIPHFQDVLIMSTNCDRCGYRDNEVKSGAAISEKGRRITLRVGFGDDDGEESGERETETKGEGEGDVDRESIREDLSRDILKSETAGLLIPEISLELTHGTLGGRFTTLEGILEQVYEELSEKIFSGGDSARAREGARETGGVSRRDGEGEEEGEESNENKEGDKDKDKDKDGEDKKRTEAEEERRRFEKFLGDLKDIKSASRPFTLILDDPLANSYIQNIYAPDPDPNMSVEEYERTWEQDEELGLNDIKVEGYGSSSGDEGGEQGDAKTEAEAGGKGES